jgi:TolA-binding protein/DNA-directed RNA polymerase subunit RPC12/RpoP
VIKFRCLRCTQKIAANDEGAGVTIACPTCQGNLVIPRQTADEFRPAASPPPAAPVPFEIVSNDSAHRREPVPASSPPSQTTTALARDGVLPHLARLMMDKLVQTLLLQRRNLMETQHTATLQVEELEQRLEAIQQKLERRLQTYERRISELQGRLAAQEQENRDLATANMRLAHRAVELEKLRAAVEAESRDADLLLRA